MGGFSKLKRIESHVVCLQAGRLFGILETEDLIDCNDAGPCYIKVAAMALDLSCTVCAKRRRIVQENCQMLLQSTSRLPSLHLLYLRSP